MITGQAPIALVTSWIYAWVVELVTLVFALALSIAVVKISPQILSDGEIVSILWPAHSFTNGWADYSSSPGSKYVSAIPDCACYWRDCCCRASVGHWPD